LFFFPIPLLSFPLLLSLAGIFGTTPPVLALEVAFFSSGFLSPLFVPYPIRVSQSAKGLTPYHPSQPSLSSFENTFLFCKFPTQQLSFSRTSPASQATVCPRTLNYFLFLAGPSIRRQVHLL